MFQRPFTEHGVLMLANVLKSERAIAMSLRIIEIFVKLREVLLTQRYFIEVEQLEQRTAHQDGDINLIYKSLKEPLNPTTAPFRKVGFKRKSEEYNTPLVPETQKKNNS